MNTRSISRIMMANVNPVERIGIRGVLSQSYELDTIQESSHPRDILSEVQNQGFDLMIIDSSSRTVQKREILTILSELRRMKSQTPVVVMGSQEDRQYAFRLYKEGISSFIDKSCPAEEFVLAIDKALGGEKYINAGLDEYFDEQTLNGNKNGDTPVHERLSWRELQVMLHMVQGMTQSEIAHKLNLSRKTVHTYKTRIYEKMHIENLKQLILYALQHGLTNLGMKADDYDR